MKNNYLDKFEQTVHERLALFLVNQNMVDNRLPEADDIMNRWEKICLCYLPDGVREFAGYPTVSLGWMMYIGMAVAHMWDDDWEMYSKFDDIYTSILLKGRGYDEMDEYISEDILKLSPGESEKTAGIVGDCAELTHTLLMHEGFEPNTPEAFNAYVRCLHRLYYFGAAVELRRLGYHMELMS